MRKIFLILAIASGLAGVAAVLQERPPAPPAPKIVCQVHADQRGTIFVCNLEPVRVKGLVRPR